MNVYFIDLFNFTFIFKRKHMKLQNRGEKGEMQNLNRPFIGRSGMK